jgi:uncharacterized lipoprotein
MKLALVLAALTLAACSPSDQAQMNRDGEKAREDARQVAVKAEAEAKVAGRVIDKDLDKARTKIHEELGKTNR